MDYDESTCWIGTLHEIIHYAGDLLYTLDGTPMRAIGTTEYHTFPESGDGIWETPCLPLSPEETERWRRPNMLADW